MGIFTQATLSLAVTAVAGCCALSASAAVTRDPGKFDLTRYRYQAKNISAFADAHARSVQAINAILYGDGQSEAPARVVANPAPSSAFGPANLIGDIDAPNGERWYYTAEFKYDTIPPHDNVVFYDYILREYTFNIYDKDMQPLGVIKSPMEYRDEEVRVVMCDLTPVATRNFFNTDDNVEVIVGLAVNAAVGHNNYRSLVYSLGKEKNDAGYDVPVCEMNDLVGDVVEGPATNGSDNFYITFMSDVMPEFEDFSDVSYWEYLCAHKAQIDIYGKATATSDGPRKLLTFDIPLLQLPGDQENVPAVISLVNDGQVYYSISYYTKPFYNDYNDPIYGDLTQREGNTLKIDMYKASENAVVLNSSTSIDVEIEPMMVDGQATSLYTYYCIGDMRYRDDFLFGRPGTEPGKPDFIITRSNYLVSIDGTLQSYFLYSNAGKRQATLFEFAQSSMMMGDIPGFEPQQMFLSQDAYGYVFNFVDIYSAKNVCQIDYNYYYDDYSDPETLSANLARTPAGDSYQYVFEMRYPEVDENENDIMRFIYIGADGTFDHFDGVNMGTNVEYAQSYLSTEALAPHAYSLSDTPAYMMLLKRGTGSGNVEELIIGETVTEENPDGKTLLYITPDSHGILNSIVPIFGNQSSLLIYRSDGSRYTLSVYALPLGGDDAGIDAVGADSDDTLTIEGSDVVADGTISVYNTAGALVASGDRRFDLSTLSAGMYIVTADGKACKLLVK